MRKILPFLLIFCLSTSGTPQSIEAAKSVYENSQGSVFLIYVNDGSGKAIAFGSGFEIAPRTLATNAHVVDGGSPTLAIGPVRIPAKILRIDHQNDLAIVTVDADLTSKPLVMSSQFVVPGEPIFAIGNPEGLENTISQGIVSGIRKEDGRSLIQITSPISHGSSGDPVLNSQGEVVGIAVGMLKEGQNLNFAVPVSYLRQLLDTSTKQTSVSNLSLERLHALIGDIQASNISFDEDSNYQKKIRDLATILNSSTKDTSDPSALKNFACVTYSEAPDDLADSVMDAAKKSLDLRPTSEPELHAVIAYELSEKAKSLDSSAERTAIVATAEKEARLSLLGGKQGNSTADYVIGELFDLEGKPTEALRVLRKALNEDRLSFACGWNQTHLILREAVAASSAAEDYAGAEEFFARLLASGSITEFDWNEEGDRRSKHADFSEAALAYGKSEKLFPINACYSSVDHYFSPKDEDDAVLSEGRKCIELATKVDSTQRKDYDKVLAGSHWVMSKTLNKRGVYQEALSHAKDAVSIDPNEASYYEAEAAALENLGRNQECIAAGQQAIRLSDGKYPSYHFQLGSCYFDAENWAAATLSFRTAAQGNQKDAAAAFNLALSLERQGYTSDAKHWYSEALSRNPDAELKQKILSALK